VEISSLLKVKWGLIKWQFKYGCATGS